MRTSKRSFFPSKEGKFNEWQLGVCKQCVADAAVWKLNAEMMTQFKNSSALANTLYIANADTAKKNKETRLYKDATFKALKEFIRNVLYPTLKANSLVADVDLVAMGFPSRGFTAHEPIPVPEEVPVLTTDVGKHHGITVYAGLKQKTHLTDSFTAQIRYLRLQTQISRGRGNSLARADFHQPQTYDHFPCRIRRETC